MQPNPLRTTVIGSYPFPSWLEYCSANLDAFGSAEIEEMVEDAVIAAVHDQVTAGLDVITDGEQTRLDFNLSFYGFIDGIEHEQKSPRYLRPAGPRPARQARHRRRTDRAQWPRRSGRVPAPATAGSGRAHAQGQHPRPLHAERAPAAQRRLPGSLRGHRGAAADRARELEDLVAAGCTEITVDEPSMSCYAYREDPERFVEIFNRTVEPVVGKCRLSTHLCFGNFKGRAVGLRRYAPMFPAFLNMAVDEIHVEMASREFAEIEIIEMIAAERDVAVGIIDVKSYYIETVDDVAERVRLCLQYAPPERLAFAPDCGLSQTARWAAKLQAAEYGGGGEAGARRD